MNNAMAYILYRKNGVKKKSKNILGNAFVENSPIRAVKTLVRKEHRSKGLSQKPLG